MPPAMLSDNIQQGFGLNFPQIGYSQEAQQVQHAIQVYKGTLCQVISNSSEQKLLFRLQDWQVEQILERMENLQVVVLLHRLHQVPVLPVLLVPVPQAVLQVLAQNSVLILAAILVSVIHAVHVSVIQVLLMNVDVVPFIMAHSQQ